MDKKYLIANLTLDEKIALVSGTDSMYTNPIPRLDIPSVSMSDGPHGLRKQKTSKTGDISSSEPATSFPTAVSTASGWNRDNLKKMGRAMAAEALHYGVDVILGPGVNIKRNPLCGRNFEYFSEDPLLAGEMGAAEVSGIQSLGVGVSTKHFALNNNETFRCVGNSIADTRAMREIYLKPFEITVKKSSPLTVMCAYNSVNGEYCAENADLLNGILRNEWCYKGLVMSDWGAVHDRCAAISSGLDLEMPGDSKICRKQLKDAILNNELPQETLDTAVGRVLDLVECAIKHEKTPADFELHNELAREIAEDCAVLLKNNSALPLNKSEHLCVIGDLFEHMRYQGSGSSLINATKVTSTKDAFDVLGVSYSYARGYRCSGEPDKALVDEALNIAKEHSKVIVFAGLTDAAESEGFDRGDMKIPENQLLLIDELARRGKEIIVVLFGGSAMELPFADNVSAILNMMLPGQNGGSAAARILFGEVSPSGRLSETWPISYDDVPCAHEYAKGSNELYRESIFVGYRYYCTKGVNVRYPFGYGLSYTSFSYDNFKATVSDGKIVAEADVTNTGKLSGGEVVQLYVKAPVTRVFKPQHELRGFEKIYLAPSECKRVKIEIPTENLAYYDARLKKWQTEDGEYEVRLCADAETVISAVTVRVDGVSGCSPDSEEIYMAYSACDFTAVNDDMFLKHCALDISLDTPTLPLTINSRFSDFRYTFWGRIIYKLVRMIMKSNYRRAKRLPEGPERDNRLKGAAFLMDIFYSNSLNTLSMSSSGRLSYNVAQGLLEIANGHVFKGIKRMLTKIKAPPLPKNITS